MRTWGTFVLRGSNWQTYPGNWLSKINRLSMLTAGCIVLCTMSWRLLLYDVARSLCYIYFLCLLLEDERQERIISPVGVLLC